MSEVPRPSRLVTLAILATSAGILLTLPLLVKETPYTFTAFMFLGQPLLLAGFLLFAMKVFQDLRAKSLL